MYVYVGLFVCASNQTRKSITLNGSSLLILKIKLLSRLALWGELNKKKLNKKN